MIKLTVNKMWTEFSYTDPHELKKIKNLLTFEEKEDIQILFNDSTQSFPTGLLHYVEKDLKAKSFKYETYNRINPLNYKADSKILDGIELWDHQVDALQAIFDNPYGTVKIPTGGGKSEVYTALIKTLDLPSLAVAGKTSHAKQLYERMKSHNIKDVGMLGGGKEEFECKHLCAVSDYVYSKIKRKDTRIKKMLSSRKILTFDEVQHLRSMTWQVIASNTENADIRIGLSATPFSDPEDPYSNISDANLIAMTGDIVYEVPVDYLIKKGHLLPAKVYMIPTLKERLSPHERNWHKIKDKGIIYSPERSNILRNLIYNIRREDKDRKILVLVEWHDQAYILLEDLYKLGIEGRYVHGGNLVTTYKNSELVSFKEDNSISNDQLEQGKIPFLIGSKIYEEAEDIPCVTDLVIASAGRDSRKSIQRVGRSLRMSGENKDIRIWDIYDNCHWMLRSQAEARIKTYKSIGYSIKIIRGYKGSLTLNP